MDRRSFLRVGGSAALVLGGTAAAGLAYLRHPGLGAATSPWRKAGESFGDPRLDALAFGILAPNPHNKQPWLFRLAGADTILVHCELSRRLPQTDPFDRQTTIGLGAMIALTRMAAAAKGHGTDVAPFPDGLPGEHLDRRPVAAIRFTEEDASTDPLFAHALSRRTNRLVFGPDIPGADDLAAIAEAGRVDDESASRPGFVRDPTDVAKLIEICDQGWSIEHGTPAVWAESVDVTRIGNREITADPDGISLSGPVMELARRTGFLTREAMRDPDSAAARQSRDFYRERILSSRAFLTLTADTDTRPGQLAAGEAWLRMHLAATARGLAFQPLSQALQEFPEMAGPYRAVHEMLAPGGVVHMVSRVGYAANSAPSPRWPLEARLEIA